MVNSQSVRVEGSGQVVDYVEQVTLQISGKAKRHTLRVLVHVDIYPAQAWGRVDLHDGKRWHELVSMRGEALRTALNCGYTDAFTALPLPNRAAYFKQDRDQLLRLAEEVL